MASLKPPVYVLEYTAKTIGAVLSAAALEGKQVEVDVYERIDASKKHVAAGQRIKDGSDMFRVSVSTGNGMHSDEWDYTILRDSAGRARKMKSDAAPANTKARMRVRAFSLERHRLMLAGTAKPALATLAVAELFDDIKADL